MARIKRYIKRFFGIEQDYPNKFSDFLKNTPEDKKLEILRQIVEESDRDQRKALNL